MANWAQFVWDLLPILHFPYKLFPPFTFFRLKVLAFEIFVKRGSVVLCEGDVWSLRTSTIGMHAWLGYPSGLTYPIDRWGAVPVGAGARRLSARSIGAMGGLL